MGPAEGGVLGLAEGEDSWGGEVGSFAEGVQGDAGEVSFADLWKLAEGFEEDGAVSGGGGELGGVLEDDGPVGGVLAFPEVVLLGFLRVEVAGLVAEI